MAMTQAQLDKLNNWKILKGNLDRIKAEEMALRKEICDELREPGNGTQTFEIANGWKAKLKFGLNYNFIKAGHKVDKAAVDKALSEIEKGPHGEILAERLVQWKPELSKTEYDKLPTWARQAIDAVIVTSEASPTLELVEPK